MRSSQRGSRSSLESKRTPPCPSCTRSVDPKALLGAAIVAAEVGGVWKKVESGSEAYASEEEPLPLALSEDEKSVCSVVRALCVWSGGFFHSEQV